MHAVRWLALLLPVTAALAGCGSSMTDVTARTAAPTQAHAVSPFCEAVTRSEEAVQPLMSWRVGQRVEDLDQLAQRIRGANEQVGALAPDELRGDTGLVTDVVNRQLRALQQSGGDTLAVARDPELVRATNDPAYAAATRRIADYVERSC